MDDRDASKTGGKRFKARQSRKILAPKTLAEPSHFSSVTAAIILLMIIVVLFTAYCVYTSWNPFAFLTDQEKSIQSIMMSVVPGTGVDTKQAEPGSKSNETGRSHPDAFNGTDKDETPPMDKNNNPQPPAGGNIEKIAPASDESATISVTRFNSSVPVANNTTVVADEKGMNRMAARQFSEDPLSLQGDE
jgi:hypothetical protein